MVGVVKDLTGLVFDEITIVSFSVVKSKVSYWNCICSCGSHIVRGRDFFSRRFHKSCGCLSREGNKRKQSHRCYGSWVNMKSRCKETKMSTKSYKNYYSRGISYCKEWEEFSKFLEDMGERPEGFTLDRIDNTGDYCKENCRWADKSVQNWNKRRKVGTTSKYIGVSLYGEKYRAYYKVRGRQVHIGYYSSEIEAALERDKCILLLEDRVELLGGSLQDHLNFPLR